MCAGFAPIQCGRGSADALPRRISTGPIGGAERTLARDPRRKRGRARRGTKKFPSRKRAGAEPDIPANRAQLYSQLKLSGHARGPGSACRCSAMMQPTRDWVWVRAPCPRCGAIQSSRPSPCSGWRLRAEGLGLGWVSILGSLTQIGAGSGCAPRRLAPDRLFLCRSGPKTCSDTPELEQVRLGKPQRYSDNRGTIGGCSG